MKRIVIVKTGGKIPSLADVAGDYEDWITGGLGDMVYPITVLDVEGDQQLPVISEVAAIVITGSASMVTERTGWMEQTASWIRQAVAQSVPLLGICFGHQLLAYALGGDVGYNPRGLEVGTATIHLSREAERDPLFNKMPVEFVAQLSHCQSVLCLPTGARLLASSEMDPHQAFAYGACAWGVQFHPEFDARIIRRFIEHYYQGLLDQGDSAQRLLAEVSESPHSASLLLRFAHLVANSARAYGDKKR